LGLPAFSAKGREFAQGTAFGAASNDGVSFGQAERRQEEGPDSQHYIGDRLSLTTVAPGMIEFSVN
jgi:hypothetical protein